MPKGVKRRPPTAEREGFVIANPITDKKRTVGNPAMTGADINLTPSENKKLMAQSLKVAMLPNIDLKDPEQVAQRVAEYFQIIAEFDTRPTVAGLGNALNGMDRTMLYEIHSGRYRHGKLPSFISPEAADVIKKAYKTLEEMMENLMATGKINPVSGIFLQKNHFGYVDKQEVTVAPATPEAEYSADDIAKRYVLPEAQDDKGDSGDENV